MTVFCAALLVILSACASSFKPCSKGGDTSFNFANITINPKEIGTSYCSQKKLEDGTFLNHGRFSQFSKTGVLIAEGEFQEGRKEGPWIQYDLKGEKIAERVFVAGVDKTPAPRPGEGGVPPDPVPHFSDQTGPFSESRNNSRNNQGLKK